MNQINPENARATIDALLFFPRKIIGLLGVIKDLTFLLIYGDDNSEESHKIN